MRIGGDLAGLPFLGVVLRRMTRKGAEHAAHVDAELDREEQARAAQAELAATTGAAAIEAGSGVPERPRLWWEDVPELAERFRRR